MQRLLLLIVSLLALASAQNAQIRILNSSPDSPPIDVFFNDKVQFSNVAYKGATNYISMEAGNYFVKVCPSNNHNKILFNSTCGFSSGFAYTGLSFGLVLSENYTSHPFGMVFQQDLNTAPKAGDHARVRLANSSPGSKPITVKVNGEEWFSSVAYQQFSDYVEVDARKDYTLNFYEEGQSDNKPLYTISNWRPGGGRVHTIVFQGIIGAVGAQALTATAYIDMAYDYCFIRTANAVPLQNVSVLMNGQLSFPSVAFKDVTEYITKPAGFYQVTVTTTDATISRNVTLSANQMLTLTAVGLGDKSNPDTPLDFVIFGDNNAAPRSVEMARVRFVHASPDAPNVDIRADHETEWFNDLPYKGATDYKEMPAGEYSIEVYSTKSKTDALATIGRQSLQGGKIYTFFIEGRLSKKTLDLVVCDDFTYSYMSLSIAHTASDAPKVDVYVDRDAFTSELLFEGISYEAVTEYKPIILWNTFNQNAVPAPSLRVIEAGKPDKVLFLITSGLQPNAVNTLTIYGLVNTNDVQRKLQYLLMADDNSAPSHREVAKLRFFHASPGAPNLDVRANDLPLFDNIGYGDLSNYIEIPAKKYERFSIFPAGNLVDPLLVITDCELKAGAVYTLFAVGIVGHSQKPLDVLSHLHASYSYVTLSVSHASPDTDAVDILINRIKVFGGLQFTQETSTITLSSGPRWVDVVPTGKQTPLLSKKIDFAPDKQNILMITGFSKRADPPLNFFLVDNAWTPPSSETKAKVRFVHLIPDVGQLDTFVNTTTLRRRVSFGEVTQYIEVEGGLLYDVAGFRSGTNESRPVIAALVRLLGGGIYTVFAEGSFANPSNIKAVLRSDYTPPPNCFLRFIHTSPDMRAVDILINNEAQFFNLDFHHATKYISLPPGAYSFKVVPAGKLSPVLIDMEGHIFAPASYHTLLIQGLVKANSLDCVDLLDDNSLPSAKDHFKIRFIHASPNAPSVNVKLNGVETFKNVVYGQVTTYSVVKTGKYRVESTLTGSHARIAADNFDYGGDPGVFTLIAEGLLHDEPEFKLYSYRDVGTPQPPSPSPPDNGGDDGKKKKLSKAGLAAIVVAAVVGSIFLIAGLTYYLVKRQRAGYTRIQ